MTQYQKFVRDQISETAALVDQIGQKTEFSDFFKGSPALSSEDIAIRLERLAAAVRHPDFVLPE
jgi:hypothetical protein